MDNRKVSRTIDISGNVYGRLKVLSYSHTKNRNTYWRCVCICGNSITVRKGALTSGGTKSCGCIRIESAIVNQEKASISNRKGQGVSSMSRLYCRYRSNARERGHEFHLSIDELIDITSKNCYYCGNAPSQICESATNYRNSNFNNIDSYTHNGIDRKDNSKGYTLSNCVPCCKQCNYSKHIMNEDDFRVWIEKVYNHYIVKGEENA